MSSKWIAIIIGSLLGAALLGISIQMLSIPHLITTDDEIPSPAAKEKAGQLTTSSTPTESITNKSAPQESITNKSAPQEPVQILSSQTTPIPEAPLP